MVLKQNFNILCVDDDVDLLAALRERLAAAGYSVDVAPNGFRALMKINADLNRFHLVITDIRMPGLDGYGVIAQSRDNGFGGIFAVYAASMTPDHRQRLRELNIRYVMEKPIPTSEMLGVIRQVQNGL